MLVPAEAGAVDESLLHLVEVEEHRHHHFVAAAHERRAGVVGQHHRGLGREGVGLLAWLVLDEAAGGLRVEPLLGVAHAQPGLLAQLVGGHRACTGHRLVQAQPVAQDRQRRAGDRAELVDHLAHQGAQLLLVNVHDRPLCHERRRRVVDLGRGSVLGLTCVGAQCRNGSVKSRRRTGTEELPETCKKTSVRDRHERSLATHAGAPRRSPSRRTCRSDTASVRARWPQRRRCRSRADRS